MADEIVFRIAAAFGAGVLLGLERQFHRQPAGLKTVILVCVGSALLMLLSLMMAGDFTDGPLPFTPGDPGRIAAQVVSGIGFLGAGAILRQGLNVKGLTTAATMWFAAAVGLACGAGKFFPAAVSLLVALCTLILMEKIEEKVFPTRQGFSLSDIQDILQAKKIIVNNVDMSVSKSSGRVKVFFQIHVPDSLDIAALCGSLEKTAFVRGVKLSSNERGH